MRHYLSLADERTEAARKESHQAVVDIDDLDNLATPEEILLSAVSGEDAQVCCSRLLIMVEEIFFFYSDLLCIRIFNPISLSFFFFGFSPA